MVKSLLSAVVAAVLALALIALAPGLASYEAAAQTFIAGAASEAGAGMSAAGGAAGASIPVLPPAAALAPMLASSSPLGAALSVPGSVFASPSAAVVAALAPAAVAASASVPISAAPSLSVPASPESSVPSLSEAPASVSAPAAVSREALSAVAARLSDAADAARAEALDALFTGSGRARALNTVVTAAASASADTTSSRIVAPAAVPSAASAAHTSPLKAALSRLGRLIGWDAPSPPAPGPDDPISGRTLAGLIGQSVPSMAAYMLVTLAFVAVAVPVVGWGGYGILMSLSPMAGIAAANVMGQVVRRMSARDAMALNTLLRVASLSALPIFHLLGIVNFGTLLVGAMAEGWLLSSIMTTQSSFLRVLFPSKQLGNINGATMLMFPAVQTVLGLFLGVGRLADVMSPYLIFAGAAAINLTLVPLIWWTIPNIKLQQGAAEASMPARAPWTVRAAGFARRYWKEALLLAAAVGVFAVLRGPAAPLPIVAALVYWVSRTEAFADLRAGRTREASAGEAAATTPAERELYRRRQWKTVCLLAMSTLMYYPLYLVAAPHVAELLAGSAHKIELAGQFLGALFLGGMISISARTTLPEIAVPLPGARRWKIGVHRLIQAAVAAMAGLWLATKIFPGSALAGLAGAAAAAGLIALGSRVTDRAWIKFAGVGFAAVWLPFVVWTWPALLPFLTVKSAMSLAMLAVGLINGPGTVSLYTYLYRATKPGDSSRVGGIQGSLYNAGISVGYALLTIAGGLLNPAYPALLAVLGVVNMIVGAAFWRAPRSLPGLAPSWLIPRKRAEG